MAAINDRRREGTLAMAKHDPPTILLYIHMPMSRVGWGWMGHRPARLAPWHDSGNATSTLATVLYVVLGQRSGDV